MADETLKSKLGKPKEEFVFGRDSLDTLLGKVKEAEKPADMSKLIDYTIGLPSGLSEKDQTYVTDQKDLFKSQADRAQKLYEQNSESTEWAKIGELFGQALVQLAAGYQGLKSGVDLSSGLKAKTTDWESRLNRLQRELDSKLTRIDRSEANLNSEEANVLTRVGRERDRQIQLAQGGIREQDAKKSAAAKTIKQTQNEEEANWLREIQQTQNRLSKQAETRNQLIVDVKTIEESLEAGELEPEVARKQIRKLIGNNSLKAGFVNTPEVNELLEKSEDTGWLWWKESGTPLYKQIEELPFISASDEDIEIMQFIQNPNTSYEVKKGLLQELKNGDLFKSQGAKPK